MTKGRILLAEDEPQIRSFLKTFLAVSHFAVVEAGDGVDALEAVRTGAGTFDLLITDIRMPRMDGFELARKFGELYPRTPVLLISGYSVGPDLLACAGAARWAFLAKPFLPKALLEKIEELLHLGNTASACGA